MGDAYMIKVKNRPGSFSFLFKQSNYDYAKWKAEQTGYKYTMKEYSYIDSRTNKSYPHMLVNLTIDKDIKKYIYNLFYTPIKEVNIEVLSKINDIGLSIWYMDDGNMFYNGKNCHLTLSTNGFSLSSISLIISWFKEKYSLEFKLNKNKSIRLTSRRECEKFMSIVEQYIPICMEYKKLSFQINKHRSSLKENQIKYINKKYL